MACSSDDSRGATSSSFAAGSSLAARLAARPDARGTDVVAVWICDVPEGTTDPTYAPGPFRLALSPEDVVERAGARLSRYFSTVSHGAYDVQLVAGGTIGMTPSETSRECVAQAIHGQIARDDRVHVVLAVGTAEHAEDAEGGWGTAGDAARCADWCTIADSRRAAYVGASDFHPDWGDTPALDLIEHELGHTLGLPHSGATGRDGEGAADADADHRGEYASALDVMSASAAPRATQPARLDGPDTLAVNRLALGWLPWEDVVTVDASSRAGVPFTLAPSTGPTGVRLAVLPLDEHRMLTVELLPATGFDDHLPTSGVAVHLVDDRGGDGTARVQQTLGAAPPFTDLLTAGESLRTHGWAVTVTSASAEGAELAVQRDDR